MRLVGASLVNVAATVVLSLSAAAAETAGTVADARDAAIRKLDLQLDFPEPRQPLPSFHFNIPEGLVWALIALGLAVILWSLKDSILAWRLPQQAPRPDGTNESGEAIDDASGDGLTATADALARAGRHAEAIHALLLQGLAEIRSSLEEPFSDSLTSREILRSTRRLTPEGRRALGEIVARVEWTHFGGREAGEADYLACRRSFDALGAALAGSVRA